MEIRYNYNIHLCSIAELVGTSMIVSSREKGSMIDGSQFQFLKKLQKLELLNANYVLESIEAYFFRDPSYF